GTHVGVDPCRAVRLRVQAPAAFAQHQAQRRQFAPELLQQQLAAQRGRPAATTQAHVAAQHALRAYQVGREQLQPEQARHVNIDLAFQRRARIPAGGDLGVDVAVALEAAAQAAADLARIELDVDAELVVADQLAPGAVAQAQAAFKRGQVHAAGPAPALRPDVGLQAHVAAQDQGAALVLRQPRMDEGQWQALALELQSLPRPVRARAQGAVAVGAGGRQARRLQLEALAGLAEGGRFLQRPGAAADRGDAQALDHALPAAAALLQLAGQDDAGRIRAVDLGIQLQVGHRAARVHIRPRDRQARLDLACLQAQVAVLSAPRQATAQAQRADARIAPLQATTFDIRFQVRGGARTADADVALHAAGASAHQHVVQAQRLQLRLDVDAVADHAAGLHPAAAQRQLQRAV